MLTKPLSILIITYNRPSDCLALCKTIAQQENIGDLLDKVIIINNASTQSYAPVIEYIHQNLQVPFQWYESPENLGVSKGRKLAFSLTSSTLAFLIDDDALLTGTDNLKSIIESFESQPNEKPVGAVSFLVKYESNQQIQKSAFPHKQFDAYKSLSTFNTAYFIGCAHAIRLSALKEAGGYPTDFFYGMEEYDLSYRIIGAGYRIIYKDTVTVLHKESPLGRQPHWQKLQQMWVNKSIVAFRYLQPIHFYTTAIAWSCFYLLQTKFHLKGWWQGWKKIIAIPKEQVRATLPDEAMQYLKKVKARLHY